MVGNFDGSRLERDVMSDGDLVADIVLEQPSQVVHMPIAEVAALAEVSEGTVVRFCDSVGCRGYQALKLALAADRAQPTLVVQEDITPADASDPAMVAQKVFASDGLPHRAAQPAGFTLCLGCHQAARLRA